MRVDELIRDLQRFPPHAKVAFEPRKMCGMGFPRFEGCHVTAEIEYGDDDEELPTGVIIVVLEDEK